MDVYYKIIDAKTGRLGMRAVTSATIDVYPPSAWVIWRDGSFGTVNIDDLISIPDDLYDSLGKLEDAITGLRAMPDTAQVIIKAIMIDIARKS